MNNMNNRLGCFTPIVGLVLAIVIYTMVVTFNGAVLLMAYNLGIQPVFNYFGLQLPQLTYLYSLLIAAVMPLFSSTNKSEQLTTTVNNFNATDDAAKAFSKVLSKVLSKLLIIFGLYIVNSIIF